MTFQDVLGRTRYVQEYQQRSWDFYSGILTQQKTEYNALDKPASVTVTDIVPQNGQTITSVTTTAAYDDQGNLVTLNDPDRGSHTYTYDPNGQMLTDTSGSRVIGTSYDLLSRVGCIQSGQPSSNGLREEV